MKNLPQELIYVLLFAAILLFQYVMKRFAPQPQQPPAADEDESAPETALEMAQIPAPAPPPKLSAGHFGRTEVPRVAPEPARRRFSRALLLGNRRAVQNAIVIATIVGPCRADQPYDIR